MLYLAVIVIGAFLLFQVQPLIAKLILPYFGGGSSIWTACMLFFQGVLLFGYCYAHILTRYLPQKKQLVFHALLLIVSLAALPIGFNAQALDIARSPLTEILVILLFSVGLPYFVLGCNRATDPILV